MCPIETRTITISEIRCNSLLVFHSLVEFILRCNNVSSLCNVASYEKRKKKREQNLKRIFSSLICYDRSENDKTQIIE